MAIKISGTTVIDDNRDIVNIVDMTASNTVTAASISSTGELIAGSYNETYSVVTSANNATTIDCELGNSFSLTLTESTTVDFINPPAANTAYALSLEVIQDSANTSYAVTWANTVLWPSATAPTLTGVVNAVDVFVFSTRDGGTTWYGFTAGQALG